MAFRVKALFVIASVLMLASPAARVAAAQTTYWALSATDSAGGALEGVIEADANGIVAAVDLFNRGAINGFVASTADVHYTLINGGLPNTGSSFGVTSSSSNGTPYFFDNLWFVVSADLKHHPVGTVLNLVANGAFLGHAGGSVRADYFGGLFNITGSLTRVLRGPAGPTGPEGPSGPAGADGDQGPTGATGPTGPTGPAGAAGADGADGAQGPTGAMGPAGTSDLPSGTVIFLLAGTPAPAGWTRIGSGMEVVKSPGGPATQLRFDAYRKD